MRVLKTEDCFYVSGGDDGDGREGGVHDGYANDSGVGVGVAGSNYDDAACPGRWEAAKALAREFGIGIGINLVTDGIKGLFGDNGAPANPGTGNPMGDPGPSYSTGGEHGSN